MLIPFPASQTGNGHHSGPNQQNQAVQNSAEVSNAACLLRSNQHQNPSVSSWAGCAYPPLQLVALLLHVYHQYNHRFDPFFDVMFMPRWFFFNESEILCLNFHPCLTINSSSMASAWSHAHATCRAVQRSSSCRLTFRPRSIRSSAANTLSWRAHCREDIINYPIRSPASGIFKGSAGCKLSTRSCFIHAVNNGCKTPHLQEGSVVLKCTEGSGELE